MAPRWAIHRTLLSLLYLMHELDSPGGGARSKLRSDRHAGRLQTGRWVLGARCALTAPERNASSEPPFPAKSVSLRLLLAGSRARSRRSQPSQLSWTDTLAWS